MNITSTYCLPLGIHKNVIFCLLENILYLDNSLNGNNTINQHLRYERYSFYYNKIHEVSPFYGVNI
jgi:hypothetical protein